MSSKPDDRVTLPAPKANDRFHLARATRLVWLSLISRTTVRAIPGTKGMTAPAIIRSAVEGNPV